MSSMMSERNHVYEAWEERFISEEKGKRVVHYYLCSRSGRSLLAVIGTEKSCRHFLYAVSEDFLNAFGSNSSVDSSTRWTARRYVVAWLISLVRKDCSEYPVTNVDNVTRHEVKEHTLSEKEEKIEPTRRKLKAKFSGSTPIGIQLAEPKSIQQPSFKIGDSVEFLCEDTGLQGCWFRSEVVQVGEQRLKVQHIDVDNGDGSGKLQEWVPAPRVATPSVDKLRMRCSGRFTLRPCPPKEPSDFPLEVGTAVDAWWFDGWWEGVVTGVPLSGEDTLHVYLPGEGKLMTVRRKDTRLSRDWVDNRWVMIMPNPEVVPLIHSSLRQNAVLELPNSSPVDINSPKTSQNLKRVHMSNNNDGGSSQKLAVAIDENRGMARKGVTEHVAYTEFNTL